MNFKKRVKKKKKLEVLVEVIASCDAEPIPQIECPKCEGDGQKLWMHGGFDVCGTCNGSGKVNEAG